MAGSIKGNNNFKNVMNYFKDMEAKNAKETPGRKNDSKKDKPHSKSYHKETPNGSENHIKVTNGETKSDDNIPKYNKETPNESEDHIKVTYGETKYNKETPNEREDHVKVTNGETKYNKGTRNEREDHVEVNNGETKYIKETPNESEDHIKIITEETKSNDNIPRYNKETPNESEQHQSINRINEETKVLEHQLKTIEDQCLENVKSLYNIDCRGNTQLQIERAAALMLISKQMKHFSEDLNEDERSYVLREIENLGREDFQTMADVLIKLDNVISKPKFRISLGNKNFVKDLCHRVNNLEFCLSNDDEDLQMSVKDTSTVDKIQFLRQKVEDVFDDIENCYRPQIHKNYMKMLLTVLNELKQISKTVENIQEEGSVKGAIAFTESVIEKLRSETNEYY